MESVVITQGLSKSYKQVHALKSLDLHVTKNSILGLLGPNGAGKTTAIKILLGLIRPTSGSASIFGLDSVRDSVSIRSRIGYLQQDPRFYEHMSARQILEHTLRFFYRGSQKQIDRRVSETLLLVGLENKADRPVKGFSSGERQRVGIGQAQVNHPELLILDEPAASLDPIGRRDALEVIDQLRGQATIIYCTHILDDVQRVSDTVAILNNGELAAYDSIESLLADKGTTYQVKLKGDTDSLYQKIRAQSWVSDIHVQVNEGIKQWTVNISDTQVAEANLFKLLTTDQKVIVTDFHIKSRQLEEVFLSVIGDEKNVNTK